MTDPAPLLPAGLQTLVDQWLANGVRARERRGLVLAGPQSWGAACARMALGPSPIEGLVWIGAEAPRGISALAPEGARRLLGGENRVAVLDAHAGLDPDALGAITGTLGAGGLLILLTPPLEDWAGFADPQQARIAVHPYRPDQVSGRFLARLAASLPGATGMLVVRAGAPLPPLPIRTEPAAPPPPSDGVCRTHDQAQAVADILRVVSGPGRRPLVLTSDRGRGKSAALGIAAAQAITQGSAKTILVTGPSATASATLFAHAGHLLPACERRGMELRLGRGQIRFVAPDALAQGRPSADLLLIDEAAALPAPLLERLLGAYPRVVFATTVHGYEGTGRGFAVRFQGTLARLAPGWQQLRLETPIRWAPGDPLEAWIDEALLLNAAPAPPEALASSRGSSLSLQRLDRDGLARDEPSLRELFGLLVLAHYRTAPTDLRQLLDGPNLSLYAARRGPHWVATALVADEGDLDAELARAVLAGRRRPRGHLIPQSLAAHLGLIEGPRMRCARIVRIAVHPSLWGQGIARRLLGYVRDQAQAAGADLLGASFGATAGLLGFWEAMGCRPVRLGLTRDKSSGLHAGLVLQPLSAGGAGLVDQARRRFLAHLPQQLAGPLGDLEPEIAQVLLRADPPHPAPDLCAQDWLEVAACAFAQRGVEDSLLPLSRLVLHALGDDPDAQGLGREQVGLLVRRVLQHHPWQRVAPELGYEGQREGLGALRAALKLLFLRHAPEAARAQAEELGLLSVPGSETPPAAPLTPARRGGP